MACGPSVPPRLCSCDTEPAGAMYRGPSVLLRPCAGATEPRWTGTVAPRSELAPRRSPALVSPFSGHGRCHPQVRVRLSVPTLPLQGSAQQQVCVVRSGILRQQPAQLVLGTAELSGVVVRTCEQQA